MAPSAIIFGCAGTRLSPEEAAFFRDADPWGFILFARNIESPGQLRALTGALRETVGRNAPVLIDQEGGRVARMGAPWWITWKPVRELCETIDDEALLQSALTLRYRLIAQELRAVGIDVNCVPLLDVATPDSHPVIANRMLGDDPRAVAARGRAVANGTLAGGVVPVIKHIPGHGRAAQDTHLGLPVLTTPRAELEARDFHPFRMLADLPVAMTAHIVFAALDAERCATQSPAVIAAIRDEIGFDGLLLTDDISMGALAGGPAERAGAALAAGVDAVLHCNGDLAEMTAIMTAVPRLEGAGLVRALRAEASRRAAEPVDVPEALSRYASMGGKVCHA